LLIFLCRVMPMESEHSWNAHPEAEPRGCLFWKHLALRELPGIKTYKIIFFPHDTWQVSWEKKKEKPKDGCFIFQNTCLLRTQKYALEHIFQTTRFLQGLHVFTYLSAWIISKCICNRCTRDTDRCTHSSSAEKSINCCKGLEVWTIRS